MLALADLSPVRGETVTGGLDRNISDTDRLIMKLPTRGCKSKQQLIVITAKAESGLLAPTFADYYIENRT